MKVVTVPTYVSDYGVSFSSEDECLTFEREMAGLNCYIINYGFDLTEGRKYYNRCAVFCDCNRAELFIRHFCESLFGTQVSFVMGAYLPTAICEYWTFSECEGTDVLSRNDWRDGLEFVALISPSGKASPALMRVIEKDSKFNLITCSADITNLKSKLNRR